MKNFIQKIYPYVISFSIIGVGCWLVVSLLMPNFVAPAWCGSLSKETCKILRDAQIATANLSYGAFQTTLTSSVDMNNGLGENAITFFGEGEYFRVPSIRQVNSEFKPLLGLNASVVLSVDVKGLNAQLIGLPEFPIELRYIDGVGYAKLRPSQTEANAIDGTWFSADLPVYMSQLVRDGILPPNLLTGMDWSSQLDFWAMFAPYADTITYEARRIDTIRYDVFEMTLSGDALYQLFFEAQINEIEAQNQNEFFSDAFNQMRDLLRGFEITLMQAVGQETGLVHLVQFTVRRDPSVSANESSDMFDMFNEAKIFMRLEFEYTRFSPMLPPEDVESIPYQDLFGRQRFPF